MTAPSHRLRVLLAGVALLATGLVLGPAAPTAAQEGLVWSVRVDDLPAVLTQRPVVVAGSARYGLGPARTARVRLVPQGALAQACPDPVAVEVAVGSDGRFRADDLRPPCNGPYEVQVVATGTFLGSPVTSPRPTREPFALADPGPAPAAPRVSSAGTAVAIRWDAVADPDVVGWTVVRDDGATTELSRDATSLTETVAPGPHHYRLVVRRWGASGPDGPPEHRTASPASPVGSVDVVRSDSGPAAVPEVPGDGAGPAAGGGAAPPARKGGSGGATPPTRRGPRPTPTTAGATGYDGELPYGAPDEAFLPQEDPPADEEAAAGTSPSARVVETSEKTAPGLVAPFALALLLATVATHIAAYLRRSARAARPAG